MDEGVGAFDAKAAANDANTRKSLIFNKMLHVAWRLLYCRYSHLSSFVMQYKQLLLAVATAVLGVQAASAATITANYNLGGASVGLNGAQVGYVTGTISPGPGSTAATVYIGGTNFTSGANDPLSNFNGWCVDVLNSLKNPSTFTVLTGDAAKTSLTSDLVAAGRGPDATAQQRVADLERLADLYFGTVDTKIESAAFQLAVWSLTYGSGYVVDTTNSLFKVVNNAYYAPGGELQSAVAQANTWLTGVQGTALANPSNNYDLLYLQDANYPKTQDMVVFLKSEASRVPEPGSLMLVGLALAAAGITARRRQS